MSNRVKSAVNNKTEVVSWGKWIQDTSSVIIAQSLEYGKWAYMSARFLGWIVVTTGIVTILPLVFEIKREAAVEELEKLQVNLAIADGRTPQELANAGLTSAVAPAVLN